MKPAVPSKELSPFTKRLKSKLPAGSMRAFAKKADIGYTTLHNYLSGLSSPTLDNLVLLARALDVTIEWLATGKEASVSHVVANDDKELTRAVQIPFVEHEGYLLLDQNLLQDRYDTNDLAALQVTTDVMEPTFRAGAVLIIDMSVKQLKENQLVVLKRGDNYLFKRVQVVAQGYNLLSDNKKYPVLFLADSELYLFEVLGCIHLIISGA
ncbi:S24 family peptidase [Serratia sp. JSRIV006]|uniref:XRE family transcriptional regulator n=1 Tax=Serratia sp. JSRIV006 TaxID=2831896 RepID=UPI001CBDC7F4|nr:S24 family peptidase [Serratia sp. JSRIV006]UAN64756.1 helix-turn-helix transcriptional regulator [Serratia sp. JSRIV006]